MAGRHIYWNSWLLYAPTDVTLKKFYFLPTLYVFWIYLRINTDFCRSQWPFGLRRRAAAARLLRSWVRIPPGAWMFVCCECCVLLGRGLCDELTTRPEESYRLWCVVCDLETSRIRRLWPALGRSATAKKKMWRINCYQLGSALL